MRCRANRRAFRAVATVGALLQRSPIGIEGQGGVGAIFILILDVCPAIQSQQ